MDNKKEGTKPEVQTMTRHRTRSANQTEAQNRKDKHRQETKPGSAQKEDAEKSTKNGRVELYLRHSRPPRSKSALELLFCEAFTSQRKFLTNLLSFGNYSMITPQSKTNGLNLVTVMSNALFRHEIIR